MSDEERSGDCVVCALRDAYSPQVCDADRSKLRTRIREIPDLYEEMTAPPEVHRDLRPFRMTVVERDTDGIAVALHRFDSPWPADPIAHHTTAAPVSGQAKGGRVTGSTERRLPVRVDPLDLAAPVRSGEVHDEYGDQTGRLSVATVLDQWVRDWRDHRGKGEGLPDPTVPALASWLVLRCDEACDDHPAIDEFFEEIRTLHAALRGVLGLIDVPDYKKGIPCPRCDALTLVRYNGGAWVECTECPQLLSPDEYDRWCGLLAANHRNVRGAA